MSHLLQMRGLKLDAGVGAASGLFVASFTDAWIETPMNLWACKKAWSHLLQMRGLKLLLNRAICLNCASHLLQMRGLKRYDALNMPEYLGRIFYRCVD